MKNYKVTLIITLIASLLLGFNSCEKIIDLKIKDADTKLVIEGSVSNYPQYNYVKLNYSKSLTNNGAFGTATGAVVTVTDNLGTTYIMTETTPGYYFNPLLIGSQNFTYTMQVQFNGETYTATATMPGSTPIDSLFSAKNEGGFFGEGYSAFMYFFDKGNETNYYRVRTYENGVKQDALYVENDELRNGIYTGIPLFGNSFNLGDTAVIELMEIDKGVYKYFKSLADIAGAQSQPAAPGNPASNISNGALGVFAAYNIESDTLVIAD